MIRMSSRDNKQTNKQVGDLVLEAKGGIEWLGNPVDGA
jgi:hypothetical protein